MDTIPPELMLSLFALSVGIIGTVIIHFRTKKFDREFRKDRNRD